MAIPAHRLYDISDTVWKQLEPHLPGREGTWGGKARDNRLFINAVFWILRTGSPWRDLPPDYGDWKNTHRRFSRWRDSNAWEPLLEQLLGDPNFEWLMVDARCTSSNPQGSSTTGINRTGPAPKYIWPWMRMICRSEHLLSKVPQQIISTRRRTRARAKAQTTATVPTTPVQELQPN